MSRTAMTARAVLVAVFLFAAPAMAEVIAKESGLKYKLTPMGTILEGDIKEVLEVIARMHETPFNKKAERVYTTIKIDDRRDIKAEMDNKVKSVMEKLS